MTALYDVKEYITVRAPVSEGAREAARYTLTSADSKETLAFTSAGKVTCLL